MKLRDPIILLLDDNFGLEEGPRVLRECGYEVRRLTDCGIPRDAKDPEIIRYCGEHKLVLVTLDKDLENRHIEEVKQSGIALLVLANNNAPMQVWLLALQAGHAEVTRKLQKTPRPCVIGLSQLGKVTRVREIKPEHKTRKSQDERYTGHPKTPRS